MIKFSVLGLTFLQKFVIKYQSHLPSNTVPSFYYTGVVLDKKSQFCLSLDINMILVRFGVLSWEKSIMNIL